MDVEIEADLHVQCGTVDVLVGDRRLVLREPGRDAHIDRAKAERAKLEGRPVEARGELLRDDDVLRRHAAVVFKFDRVRQFLSGGHKLLGAEAGRANEGVGVRA